MQIKKIASFDVRDGASTVRYADLDDGISFFPTDGIINIKSNKVRIAGFGVDANSLYRIDSSGSMYPLGDQNSVFLSNVGKETGTSIGGSTGNNKWLLAISDDFGVTDDGSLYARNANISGEINAERGSIGNWTITNDSLESQTTDIISDKIKKTASLAPSKFLFGINSSYLKFDSSFYYPFDYPVFKGSFVAVSIETPNYKSLMHLFKRDARRNSSKVATGFERTKISTEEAIKEKLHFETRIVQDNSYIRLDAYEFNESDNVKIDDLIETYKSAAYFYIDSRSFRFGINNNSLINSADKNLELNYVRRINFSSGLSIEGDFLGQGQTILNTFAYPNQSATFSFSSDAKFRFFTVSLRGDDNNGTTFTISRWQMEHHYSPFYLDVMDVANQGYTAKADGNVYNYSIFIHYVITTGWSRIQVQVSGIY